MYASVGVCVRTSYLLMCLSVRLTFQPLEEEGDRDRWKISKCALFITSMRCVGMALKKKKKSTPTLMHCYYSIIDALMELEYIIPTGQSVVHYGSSSRLEWAARRAIYPNE